MLLQMESLYSKLYDKYAKLKVNKFAELDHVNKDQEVKFLNYVSAAEELMEHLKNENNELRTKVDELKNEVAFISSAKDEHAAKYEQLLMEENQKNIALSKELERLKILQREGSRCNSEVQNLENVRLNTPGGAQAGSTGMSNSSTRRMTRKQAKRSREEAEYTVTPSMTDQVRESAKDVSKGTMCIGPLITIEQPECCRRTVDSLGRGGNDNGTTTCLFQSLVEYLVGMKLSTVNQNEGICILAMHQSSGYSFSLTYVKLASKEETEFMYRVISLGTFERVAPEWMREVILFSTSMCPMFFERLSRVIKLHS